MKHSRLQRPRGAASGCLGLVILLSACAPLPPDLPQATTLAQLAGTHWVWTAPGAEQAPRLEFSASGQISGSTGCNVLTGQATDGPSGVSLGPLATTKRLCVGPGRATELAFLDALQQVRTLVRRRDRLELLDEAGRRVLSLDAKSPPVP